MSTIRWFWHNGGKPFAVAIILAVVAIAILVIRFNADEATRILHCPSRECFN